MARVYDRTMSGGSFARSVDLLDLVGPGSIADAHGALEKVALEEVEAAVPLYLDLARGLRTQAEEYLEPRPAFMEHSPPAS
ncbi:MAG: hypothetical protein ACRD1B_04285 [Thermoanaerobaculia bacterium]